ncbi:hypothetical protein BHE74_00023790 [Ensete ventricosum]|nr:hypothetical protein BHE74_00023790 [Ensete ventricosum]
MGVGCQDGWRGRGRRYCERGREIWSNPLTLIAEGWSAIGERKFEGSDRNEKVQEPATGLRGRSRCNNGNWRPLGCDIGGRRRGAAVAPDDGSLLVAVKGSR